jgi:hypothetical protein
MFSDAEEDMKEGLGSFLLRARDSSQLDKSWGSWKKIKKNYVPKKKCVAQLMED